MRVLLGIPPYDFRDFYPEYMARRTRSGRGLVPGATPPLGLLYIAAVLRQAGHDVFFLDGVEAREEDFIATIRREQIGFVGLLMMGYGWATGQPFLTALKEACPDIHLSVGGPWPDLRQRECLQENAAVDTAAAGDGETISLALVEALDARTPLADVRGIAWRDGDAIVVNPDAELIYDLDSLPHPARDLVDLRRYSPAIGHYHRLPCTTMIGQRGCRHKCIFCHTNTWMRHGERYRSAEGVVNEMEELQGRYGVRDILFWDNNITESREVIYDRCEEIIRRDLGVIWSGNTRCDTIDLDMARLMRRAGCWKLLIGIESGSQRSLDVLEKGETLEQLERGVAACRQAGIRVFATFIFGVPGETYEEGLKTIEFANKLNADYTKFFTLAAHPGTTLHDKLDLYGTCLGHASSQSHQSGGFLPHTMTKKELDTLLHRANRSFYMRPRYLAYKLRTMRNLEDARQNLRGFRAYSRAFLTERSVASR